MDFRSLPTNLVNTRPRKSATQLSPGSSNIALSPSPRNSMVDLTIGQEYDFVEEPPQDFFCPVTLDLLVDPHQTVCCGNHISSEATTRLQREEKPCPICKEPNFQSMPDKHYRRRVLELCVKCPHVGCNWTGEIRQYNTHIRECPKREWNCQYCDLKCTFDEGESAHWAECEMFPETCPNKCEVCFVARKNVEQHKTVCSLEPVTCEMRVYGCQAVIPRKDIALHMKENEGQHSLALAILNYEEMKIKNKTLTQVQQSLHQLQQSISRMEKELITLKEKVTHIEMHAAGGEYESCTTHTFSNYSQLKLSERDHESNPFFYRGYQFNFRIRCYRPPYDMLVVFLCLLPSDGDDEQSWPVTINCQVEQINQIGERGHRKCSSTLSWTRAERSVWRSIDTYEMKYTDLEKNRQNVQYVVRDTIVYRLHLQIIP